MLNQSLFSKYQPSKEIQKTKKRGITNERQLALKDVLDHLPYMKPRVVAIRCSHLSLEDLYWLKGRLKEHANPPALFNWFLSKKRNDKTTGK